MKRIYFLIAALLIVTSTFAQGDVQSEVELIQSLYGMEKKELVAEFVELDANEEAEFWSLYNEYETKRKAIGKKRFDLLINYVDEFGDINPANAEEFMSKSLPLRKDSESLLRSYYKKIKKKTDPVVATQFFQIESYLSDAIRLELLEELYVSKN